MQTKSEMINRIAELAKENAELKAELQNFKDMAKKGLDEFKDVGGCWGCGLQLQLNQDMEDIKQLKAESERLKQEWRLDCLKCEYKNTKADVDKYKQTLQEIKEIAESYIKGCSDCSLIAEPYECEDCTDGGMAKLGKKIIDLITKAESEG